MSIFQQNLLHTQELYKQVRDKGFRVPSYMSSKKVWFNNKYIKIKQNQKLKKKFFDFFQLLLFVDN